ncbi:hypothetical protein FXO37_34919 [Capsicum annuum]|nr:hypothetical protein FXO37_34919 [Capsicum annuum]
MGGMFSKFVYNNLRPNHEEVQSLDLQMIEGFELNDAESGFSNETVADRSGEKSVVDIHSHSDLDIQGFEDFSIVPPTKILMKAGLISDASASEPIKRRRTVRFDAGTVEDQGFEKTPSTVSRRTVPTEKIPTSNSERVHVGKTAPLSSSKSVRQDNSNEKWDEIKLFLQSYVVGNIAKSIGIESGEDTMEDAYFD